MCYSVTIVILKGTKVGKTSLIHRAAATAGVWPRPAGYWVTVARLMKNSKKKKQPQSVSIRISQPRMQDSYYAVLQYFHLEYSSAPVYKYIVNVWKSAQWHSRTNMIDSSLLGR